ncbi:hypothetical protein JB92DRAFT_2833428 [Gautieria morchelliformis]|nr:hypothetical protein JB92DRAFT_2833428 [Gautieria morchelliformis]
MDAFFPFPEHDGETARNSDILQSLAEFYGETNWPSAKNVDGVRDKNLSNGWKRIPEPPVYREQHRIQEDQMTEALVPIINTIISYQALSDRRVAIDRQQNPIRTFADGTPAFLDASGVPRPKPLPANERKMRSAEDKNAADQEPHIDWRWTRNIKNDQAKFHLASYVRKVFAAQPHRRLVPSLMFTESTVEYFLWDRASVVFSEALDHHAKAERFYNIIATMVLWNDENLGFDTSMQFQASDTLRILTRSGAYKVDTAGSLLTQPYNIRSHGSTCWRARRSDVSDEPVYLIEDTWSENWGCAGIVRETVEEVRLKHRHLTPAEWVWFEPATGTGPSHINLGGPRSLWRCEGGKCVPLEKCNSVRELVSALRDVVQELKILFLESRMMHRDITIWNIYIHRGTNGESRGFMDFPHAGFSDGCTIYPRSGRTPVGTQLALTVLSRHILEQRPPTHCDDLESVYFVLTLIVTSHTGLDTPRLASTDLPQLMDTDPVAVATAKNDHLEAEESEIPVQDVCWVATFDIQTSTLFSRSQKSHGYDGPTTGLTKNPQRIASLKLYAGVKSEIFVIPRDDGSNSIAETCHFCMVVKSLREYDARAIPKKVFDK